MQRTFVMLCVLGTILLLALIVPVTAEASTISSISPSQGYTGTTTGTITITGANFNTTLVYVRLVKAGESNITATISSHSSTTIRCKFTISSSETLGTWDVVVVNQDGSEVVDSGAFTIRKTITLTSISPTSAKTNDDAVTITIVGTGFSDIDNMYLYNEDYDNITADITSHTSTKVIGILDLDNAEIDSYDVCVEDSFGTIKCGLDFEIVSDKVGSIEITSSPSGAKIYLDSTYEGITPSTLDDVSLGSHKIVISKTGYEEWSRLVTIKAGITITVDADLIEIQTTTVPTVLPTTVKTPLKANTVKVPTPWPTDSTTPAASIEPFIILGAVSMIFVILRKQ
jgi:hypothetical protein